MKPLISEAQDADALHELGRASVQIIHDLKNQINGLKLYATFLRKRMEKSERPVDEQETITKLIAGLERAAADMTVLVRYGRPLELRRQPHTDLTQTLIAATEGGTVKIEAGSYQGEFDATALAEAFKSITAGARGGYEAKTGDIAIHLRRNDNGRTPTAIIEWRGARNSGETELFRSFAGGNGLRMALAAKIIRAHGGEVEHDGDTLRARLPLRRDEG